MATVNTEHALAEYQKRVGALMNEIIMRDVAIEDLEEGARQLQQENADLRTQIHNLTADRGPTAPTDLD